MVDERQKGLYFFHVTCHSVSPLTAGVPGGNYIECGRRFPSAQIVRPYLARLIGRVSTLLVILLTSHVISAAVVGSGTPSSCSEAALASAIPAGGIVTFNCGAGQVTIPFTFTLVVGSDNPPVIIDGNDSITFDGTGITTGMIAIFGET